MPEHLNKPMVETANEVRSGEIGHNVRYVLFYGLGGVIVAFVALFWFFGR